MRTRPVTSLMVAAIALAATAVRHAPAATIVVPPDPSTLEPQQLVSNVCSKCHQATGVSISPLFPNLAGQLPVYIENELKLFRQRGRSDQRARAFMWGIARGLTDEQIKGVARIFSSKPPAPGTPSRNPALADKGKLLYHGGAKERNIEACAVCHGADGQGVNTNPRIAGQKRDYLKTAMLQFRAGQRENKVMQDVTRNLTDDEIAGLVDYMASK
jgi:cytochrome c553